MGTQQARNILSTPCWTLERRYRGLSDLDASFLNEGKRRVAGYGHKPCVIQGTKRLSKFNQKPNSRMYNFFEVSGHIILIVLRVEVYVWVS
jgi:hypothetical protein